MALTIERNGDGPFLKYDDPRTLRVLCVGTSMTEGVTDQVSSEELGGYRPWLQDLYSRHGVLVDFVGSLTTQDGTSSGAPTGLRVYGDYNHYGVSGATLATVMANAATEAALHKPDLMIVEAGANDTFANALDAENQWHDRTVALYQAYPLARALLVGRTVRKDGSNAWIEYGSQAQYQTEGLKRAVDRLRGAGYPVRGLNPGSTQMARHWNQAWHRYDTGPTLDTVHYGNIGNYRFALTIFKALCGAGALTSAGWPSYAERKTAAPSTVKGYECPTGAVVTPVGATDSLNVVFWNGTTGTIPATWTRGKEFPAVVVRIDDSSTVTDTVISHFPAGVDHG